MNHFSVYKKAVTAPEHSLDGDRSCDSFNNTTFPTR